jgi:oligoendopeptidase F
MARTAARKKSPPRRKPAGAAPTWVLDDLYPGRDSPALAADFKRLDEGLAAFETEYKGKLALLDGDGLADALQRDEALGEIGQRIATYAQLLRAANAEDAAIGQFAQNCFDRLTAMSARTVFFRLELNRIPDDALEARLAQSPRLRHYRPYLRDLRALRPHQLSDEIEQFVHDTAPSGAAAWVRLFDDTVAAMRFRLGGRTLTEAQILDLFQHKRRATRRAAGAAFAKGLAERQRLFAHITNTLAKDKEVADRWRKFPRPVSSRNLSNLVEDEVVDALVAAVKGAYPRISHRYYGLKARWLKLPKLAYYDRNAPLPDAPERRVPWAEARDTVLGAYARFSPELAEIGRRFFDQRWIDAEARPGKDPGAFSHPSVPSVHPYILMNYQGRTRDVMTLAHELGHGVHQVLAGVQGLYMCETPLTLAETASVFGEMLTFRATLAGETDPRRKKALLARKVEDMINTVIRQISFFEFERQVHDERRRSELLPERLGEIWMDVQGRALGPAFRLDKEYSVYWAYIGHFIHAPFYVYAYAFGDCLVNSLYAVYQNAAPGFAEKYLDMLRAGGTKRHKELLAPFGLDAGDPAFWDKGLGVIEGFIDELERMG